MSRLIQIGDLVRVCTGGDNLPPCRPTGFVGTIIGFTDKPGLELAVDFPGFERGHDCISRDCNLSRSTTTSVSGWWLSIKDVELVEETDSQQPVAQLHPDRRYQIIMGEEWE